MASVSQLVLFRMLLDQLNEAEFSRFIKDLTAKCGRNIICTALFNQFSDSKYGTFSQQILEAMMTITKDIIKDRTKTDNTHRQLPFNMQSVSTALIGEIASFLGHSDYLSFAKCQRATYIGCTSPCTLRALDLTEVEDFGLVDLCKYPQIRFLALAVGKFNGLVLPKNQNICTHLKRLELQGSYDGIAEIEGLLNQTALSFTEITHLKLRYLGNSEGALFPTDTMLRLLSKFPCTQCLWMDEVYFSLDDSWTSQLMKYLPELISVMAEDCDVDCLNRLISVFGKQLRALYTDESDMEMPQNVCFKAMEELSLCCPPGSGSVMDIIRRSTQSLQRFYFEWGESDETLVMELLSEQKQLQQLVITIDMEDEDLQTACGALDRALFNIRKIEKEKIQIALALVGQDELPKASDIVYSINRVVNALKASKIRDFSFRCSFPNQSVGRIENLESELTYLKEQISSQCDVHHNDDLIVVTNNGCAINECIFGSLYRGWLTDF